jgi:thiosulfate/3-mercaptopyruvate sulfurtransferase
LYTTIISPEDLHKHLADPNWVICDCRFDLTTPTRGRSDYLYGHIPHAVYVDLESDLSSTPNGTNGRHPLPPADKLIQLIESLGIDNDTQVIVYDDDSGGYAVRLWWILRYLGHSSAAVLDGGIQAWLASGYTLSSEQEHRSPHDFRPHILRDRLITVDQLSGKKPGARILLLDARAPERYRGEQEPLDPVAGHIPSAENRYWRKNLRPDGRFKSVDELQHELTALLGDRSSDEAIIYCGSGVTACHNILAFVHAGFGMPRLYAGAWSEWCSDPTRATETSVAAADL